MRLYDGMFLGLGFFYLNGWSSTLSFKSSLLLYLLRLRGFLALLIGLAVLREFALLSLVGEMRLLPLSIDSLTSLMTLFLNSLPTYRYYDLIWLLNDPPDETVPDLID